MLVAAFFMMATKQTGDAGDAVKRPCPAGLHWSGAEDDEVLANENAPPRTGYQAKLPRVSWRRD
jgi:hypothetical protein